MHVRVLGEYKSINLDREENNNFIVYGLVNSVMHLPGHPKDTLIRVQEILDFLLEPPGYAVLID